MPPPKSAGNLAEVFRGLGRSKTLVAHSLAQAPGLGIRTLPGYFSARNEPRPRLFLACGLAKLLNIARLNGIACSLKVAEKQGPDSTAQVLSLLKAHSIGLKSEEHGSRYHSRTPYFLTTCSIPLTLCPNRLSSTTSSPGRSVGSSTWSRQAEKTAPSTAPLMRNSAPAPGVNAAISVPFGPPCNDTA